ncbi:hypothetical protein SESBI_50376 [Sesbania bispinosa]|nr:hypothetical protein SESBI_50376 [Sesbania bispinosa]
MESSSQQASGKKIQLVGATAASTPIACGLVKPTGDNIDMAWSWNSLKNPNDRKRVTCDFCGKTTSGGITRVMAPKRHQMGISGDVQGWRKTPADVKMILKEAHDKRN